MDLSPKGSRAGAARPSRDVWTVSRLTGRIKETLEGAFPQVLVGGEVSDVSQPRSGHIYFSLKDSQAQIRAVMWRTAAERLTFDLQDGQQVVCEGALDVYPPRGGYQLVVRKIEPIGLGELQRRLQRLHQQLSAEGLFDRRHKQPLPRFARRVALVTSPTGAAVRDFVEVARRRWAALRVLVAPVRVQGAGAHLEIAAMLDRLQTLRNPLDVIVVARGGGSPEDLWTFNEEPLVRAVFRSKIPIVSAIGHEVDVTLCDLAADARALTPTEAAELVAPSGVEIAAQLAQLGSRLTQSLRTRAATARARLESAAQRPVLARPLAPLGQRRLRLDDLQGRAQRALARRLDSSRDQWRRLAGQLESLSPLGVLARGYSVTTTPQGAPLTDASQARVGQSIVTRLAAGQLVSRIEQVAPNQPGKETA